MLSRNWITTQLPKKIHSPKPRLKVADFRKEATAYSLNSTSNDRGEIILLIMVT